MYLPTSPASSTNYPTVFPPQILQKSSESTIDATQFEALNQAFQLATGWELAMKHAKGKQLKLFISDLSELSFGARIGRRYADNLLSVFNSVLNSNSKCQTGSAVTSAGRTLLPLFSNFEIATAHPDQFSSPARATTDWITREDGVTVFLHADFANEHWNSPQAIDPNSSLKAGLHCLAETVPNPHEMVKQLQAMMWRMTASDAAVPLSCMFLDDHRFEYSAEIDDRFRIGIWDLNSGKMSAHQQSASSKTPQWLGIGQVLLLFKTNDLASPSIAGGHELSLQTLRNLSAQQIGELFEPGLCQLVLKRK